MYSLAFDTTGAGCSIALYNNDKPVEVFCECMDFGQSEALIPEIEKMLKRNKLSFDKIGVLSVCVGPGSFTGVRSSISAAKAFGIACEKLALTGVSAFEAYINAVEDEKLAEVNAVVIETKREDFYYQLFDNKRVKLCEAGALNREDINALLKGKKVSFAGDGVERFLNGSAGFSVCSVSPFTSLPIESLAKCGIKKFENKRLDFPKPLYLRAPDVCVRKA